MQKIIYRLLIALFFISIAGCSKDEMIQKFAPTEDQALAKNYFSLLKNRQFEDITKAIDPSLQDPTLKDALSKMADLIPVEEPINIKLIGVQKHHSADQDSINLTYEYAYASQWLIMDITLKQQNNQTNIIGLHVIPQTTSIEEKLKFSLAEKSVTQYLFLVLAIIIPLLVLTALIICIRMKLRGRKWPWIVFILFGFGQFSINWSTGDMAFSALAIQALSASAFVVPYGPWIITVSLPLGAICFLAFRKNHAAEPLQNTASIQASDNLSTNGKVE